jgi:hypothetical protein
MKHAANDEPMNFVVAYPWPGEEHRLSIYTYGSDVQQQGTMEHATWLLDRARTRSPGKPWAIYRVEFTPIDGVAPVEGKSHE